MPDQLSGPLLEAPTTVAITPSPRILKVLGNIEFEPWQCIAELADNSFDEFLSIKRSGIDWNEPLEVAVLLPAASVPRAEAIIEVRDNGRGMTLEQVANAARAGWTSNDPVSRLGLFGMGFNVATARLGLKTRILSTQSGQPDWVGIEIDLDDIGPDFAAPVVRQLKSSLGEHGTRIEISDLEQRADWLRRSPNQTKLRETLGGIYSHLLDAEGFRLRVNGVQVRPVHHCAWSANRSVTRGGEVIPAYIPIDIPLSDQDVCLSCGVWQDPENRSCEACGSHRLELRDRRIWGWLGIRRNLDSKEFGIDFLRNGRKILRFDKSLFRWRDPDDPSDQGDVEYPIEVPANQGRIIGEIHLDHVPVNYTKDSFDTSDRSWRYAVRMLRGDAPLKPEAARQLGRDNDSPLARLFRGYRRNDPGQNYLMPGNGESRIDTKDWERRFKGGESEYQSDAKWWEAVVEHDDLKEAKKRAQEERQLAAVAALDDPTAEFTPITPPITPSPVSAATAAAVVEPATERDRVETLLDAGRAMPELDARFTAAGLPGRPVTLKAYQVNGTPVKTPEGKRVPVWLAPRRGGAFAAFVDGDHPHFQRFDDDPADLVLMELAQHLIARAPGATASISAVFAELKDRYLASRTIDLGRLAGQAGQLVRDIKERMEPRIADNPERPWENTLTRAERDLTEERIVEVLRVADITPTLQDGSYLRFVPDSVVPRIVEEWPDPFFDGQVFQAPYRDVNSVVARRHTVATVTGYLNDIVWLAQGPESQSREQLIRARLSLQLLPDELAEPPS